MIMNKIRIVARASDLTINGKTWSAAPLTSDLCRALGAEPPQNGDFVIIGRKKESMFRYFDNLGISILEKIPESRVMRIDIHFQAQGGMKKKTSPYGSGVARITSESFHGILELNGKELTSPLPFGRFPERGDMEFVNRIAIGAAICAMVSVETRMVQTISFDFASFEQ